MSAIPPLLGDKRTSRGRPNSVAIDPKLPLPSLSDRLPWTFR
jgi:hypothetical protein